MTNEDFDNENDDDAYGGDNDDAGAGGDDDAAGDDDHGNGDDDAAGNGDDDAAGNGDDDAAGNGDDDGGNAYDGNGDADGGDGDDANEYDPYEDFDIEQCDTYEYLWLWDLSLTCESEDTLDSCECIFAEQLMEDGLLSCDDMGLCPADCKICTTCFQLMGCLGGVNGNGTVTARSPLYIFLAAAGILIIGGVYYYARKRRRGTSELAAHLMAEDASAMGGFPSSKEPQVWLAPDIPSTQFQPSHKAAVQASSDESSTPGFLPICLMPKRKKKSEDENVWLAPVP